MPTDAEIIAGIGDGLPVGVWVARAPNGEFVYSNEKFKEIMGIAGLKDPARGAYAEPYKIYNREGELYPEDQMPFVRALVEQNTVMVDDLVIHRNDGEEVNVRAYARPVFEDDAIAYVVIAFFDITREVHAEQARADSEKRMAQAQRMESLGNLAGGIAHDFNNLLGAIKLIASTLRMQEANAERAGQLETIETVTETATNLARALLTFAGRGKNLAAPISPNRTIRSVQRIFEHALDKRIKLVLELSATRNVLGDHARLEQVVMNLVLNARDAMPNGGKLTIRTVDLGPDVFIEVLDQGPGVPVEIRQRIFEPFFSTKGERSSASGLGLATVYGIVESHGGAIEVRDAPGGGALFRLRLPAIAGTTRDRPSAPDALVVGQGLVLVVDDEAVLREAACHVLASLGYDTIGAEDGAHAIELYRERADEIDVVVLDMTMPGLDGRSTYVAMREIRPDVRVLLTTGYALNEEAQSILDLGVRGFIEKPWNAAELSSAIAKVLR
ncbi:MAG: ATP-binding protein [Myxococcota bacterium]